HRTAGAYLVAAFAAKLTAAMAPAATARACLLQRGLDLGRVDHAVAVGVEAGEALAHLLVELLSGHVAPPAAHEAEAGPHAVAAMGPAIHQAAHAAMTMAGCGNGNGGAACDQNRRNNKDFLLGHSSLLLERNLLSRRQTGAERGIRRWGRLRKVINR